jgi:hypothetical protein
MLETGNVTVDAVTGTDSGALGGFEAARPHSSIRGGMGRANGYKPPPFRLADNSCSVAPEDYPERPKVQHFTARRRQLG